MSKENENFNFPERPPEDFLNDAGLNHSKNFPDVDSPIVISERERASIRAIVEKFMNILSKADKTRDCADET